jgi:hypothetical protein
MTKQKHDGKTAAFRVTKPEARSLAFARDDKQGCITEAGFLAEDLAFGFTGF